jgi:hypothetical protein
LRRLRDLNLITGPIAVREGLIAHLAGCSSLDAPAENGVRYRLRTNDASERVMELAWTPEGLQLSLMHLMWSDASRAASNASQATTAASRATTTASRSSTATPSIAAVANPASVRLRVPVTCDRKGRACVPAMGARVSPSSTDEQELEHFLRRAVRTLLA